MVTLLDPPTPRTPPATQSDVLVSEHEKRVNAEIQQLLIDIRRIGPTYPPGSPHVLFGELFDDDDVQQYYEALVGTLKCAKKRGVITFKGQMLLKGMHDDVKISIVENKDAEEEAKTQKVETGTAPKANETEEPKKDETLDQTPNETKATKPKPKPTNHDAEKGYEAMLKRQSPQKFSFHSSPRVTPTSSPVVSRRKSRSSTNKEVVETSPLRTRSPFSKRQSVGTLSDASMSPYRSPIVTKRKNEIAGTSSDGEAEVFARQYPPPPPVGACSDSEADGRTTRRGRVTLPPVFLAQKSMSSMDTSGRPPAPWRMRKAKSSMNVTKNSDVATTTRRASISGLQSKPIARKKEPVVREKDVSSTVETAREAKVELPHVETEILKAKDGTSEKKQAEPVSPTSTKENDGSSGNVASSKTSSFKATTPEPVKQKSFLLSREASMRVDSEVHQLMKDICRVGSNPGEPSVTFGELFDDETVQDTYEALVGTLRSAKRQGYIDFKGQMLFKGMHDDVTINVVEQTRPEAVA